LELERQTGIRLGFALRAWRLLARGAHGNVNLSVCFCGRNGSSSATSGAGQGAQERRQIGAELEHHARLLSVVCSEKPTVPSNRAILLEATPEHRRFALAPGITSQARARACGNSWARFRGHGARGGAVPLFFQNGRSSGARRTGASRRNRGGDPRALGAGPLDCACRGRDRDRPGTELKSRPIRGDQRDGLTGRISARFSWLPNVGNGGSPSSCSGCTGRSRPRRRLPCAR